MRPELLGELGRKTPRAHANARNADDPLRVGQAMIQKVLGLRQNAATQVTVQISCVRLPDHDFGQPVPARNSTAPRPRAERAERLQNAASTPAVPTARYSSGRARRNTVGGTLAIAAYGPWP